MGQHKFNPTAQAARAGKLPPKPHRTSAAETRTEIRRAMRAIKKAMGTDKPVATTHGALPEEPPRKIKTWEELDGLVSADGRYKIEVELKYGCGHIRPTFDVPDSERWNHFEYLSTHTFYERTRRQYTEILQRYGFNVELVSWG